MDASHHLGRAHRCAAKQGFCACMCLAGPGLATLGSRHHRQLCSAAWMAETLCAATLQPFHLPLACLPCSLPVRHACLSAAHRLHIALLQTAAAYQLNFKLLLSLAAGTPHAADHRCSRLHKVALWCPAGKIYAKARALFVAPSSQRLAKDVFNYLKDGMVIKAPAASASSITTGSM